METFQETLLAVLAGIGVITVLTLAFKVVRWLLVREERSVYKLIRKHFQRQPLKELVVTVRDFPYRVRADLQRAVDRLVTAETKVLHFCNVQMGNCYDGIHLSDFLVENSMIVVPPQYEDVDIGEEKPVQCLRSGLWFLEQRGVRYLVLLSPSVKRFEVAGVQFQLAVAKGADGAGIAEAFFKQLEESVTRSESYRGKVLSLEQTEAAYTGQATGIKVHRLHGVEREQVILPRRTLELLERNVIQFVRQRPQLARFRQATKKGLLFYGPPGTGKTHTIHYLAGALRGHTTLLITAEQVGLLDEYMTLARLLQPSIVIIEDADLIARDRTHMTSSGEEALLNKLLNEMDGLRPEADILFILTTNRPEMLEGALASRPGRVDQAIEFPLPDEEGRAKLVRLYCQGVDLPEEVLPEVVSRTDRVSAAFIKELMRRSVQFHLEADGSGRLQLSDFEQALDEMLFTGGSLNLKLLGAGKHRAAIGYPPPQTATACVARTNASDAPTAGPSGDSQ